MAERVALGIHFSSLDAMLKRSPLQGRMRPQNVGLTQTSQHHQFGWAGRSPIQNLIRTFFVTGFEVPRNGWVFGKRWFFASIRNTYGVDTLGAGAALGYAVSGSSAHPPACQEEQCRNRNEHKHKHGRVGGNSYHIGNKRYQPPDELPFPGYRQTYQPGPHRYEAKVVAGVQRPWSAPKS